MKVLKFGGSSVAKAANIEKVLNVAIEAARSERCIVVLSAMQGTTDDIITAGRLAEKGDLLFESKLKEIKDRHTLATDILLTKEKDEIFGYINSSINEIKALCDGTVLINELTPRTLDRLISYGELMSTRIFAAKLTEMGESNRLIDSRGLVKTDSNFGAAAVNFADTNKNIVDVIASSDEKILVVPGFIGSNSAGLTTTLGRGGSDYTAAIFAAATTADVLEIWTDVSGMMSADPRFVKNVKQIESITYREAMELSHFGAKVIYPPTIQPVMSKGIPVRVKNTFEPDNPGTLIQADDESGNSIIRGITNIDKIALLNLEGSGMVGIPGFSRRLFESLSRSMINVILITQSSSEQSICVAVEEKSGDAAKKAVDTEFEYEINAGKIDALRVENGYSILALVGDNMRNHTGVSGKMFSTLGQNGINITAIAQGSSERNISAVISSSDVRKAVNSLHEEFFSDGVKQVNLFIAGTGTVGSKLLDQIAQQHEHLVNDLRLSLRVIGIANSRYVTAEDGGIDLQNWRDAVKIKADDASAAAIKINELVLDKNQRNSIFVDVTANDQIVETYTELLKKSVSVVACNKVACSSELTKYKELKSLSREYGANFLFETNVGAGLPIINTLNDLKRSGDKINRIEAVLSGTLNFVFNNYDGSRKFAEVVRQAQDEGYTEPDPRLDLSGTDVARKILILAREAGFELEFADIANEAFLPATCFEGSVDDFYIAMANNEDHFKSMLDKAVADGNMLKYIASFADGRASVGLQSISIEHNFANLSGKDNAVLFYTSRYPEQPLVIKGAGAGADVTAAGVFADIIRAARI